MMRLAVALGLFLIGSPALAQTRYDHDGRWIYESIKQERQRERREARREARFYRNDSRDSSYHHHHEPRRYYWVEHSRRYANRDREDYSTRVYGVVMRRHQFVQRHATSQIECFAPIRQFSQERSSEALALNDAELGWAAQAQATYGQMWGDYRYAANKIKQCFRSSVDESTLGKNREALTQNLGLGDGFKSKCVVTANPCQAPVEVSPESRQEVRTGRQ